MPTLFRLLLVVAVLAGMVWGGMLALATFVKPDYRQMSETVAPTRLNQ